MKIIFETERLYIRHYTKADADYFFQLNGDPAVMQYIREPKSREACDLFLVQTIDYYKQHPQLGRWAMLEKDTDVFVGSFAVIPVENTLNIQLGYALLSQHWGKGYATESTKGGMQYAFNVMGLEKIFAITQVPNIASQKVLLKSGFVQIENIVENGRELFYFTASRP
jgi:ribosomal-protein-alanine N-acetyltransferase